MLKEAQRMNETFMKIESKEMENQIEKKEIYYEYAGYQVRVHFCGNKTLAQCMKNLVERKL